MIDMDAGGLNGKLRLDHSMFPWMLLELDGMAEGPEPWEHGAWGVRQSLLERIASTIMGRRDLVKENLIRGYDAPWVKRPETGYKKWECVTYQDGSRRDEIVRQLIPEIRAVVS